MKKTVAPVVAFVGVVIGSAISAAAQTSTVTLPGGDTYNVSTVGSSVTVTKVDRGDPRLRAWRLDDPENVKPAYASLGVTVEPPVLLGKTFDDPLNIFITFGHKRDDVVFPRDPKPPYPVELYMQLYPFMFPPPTVEQARVGTDLVWKYHVRTEVGAIMGQKPMTWEQFQKYQKKEIERAQKNEEKQRKAEAKERKE